MKRHLAQKMRYNSNHHPLNRLSLNHNLLRPLEHFNSHTTWVVKRVSFFIFLIGLFATSLLAQSPPADAVLVIKNTDEILKPGTYLYILEDKSNALTLEQVQQPEVHKQFVRQQVDYASKPANPFSYWVRLTVQNNTEESFWISNETTFVHYIDYYVVLPTPDGGKVLHPQSYHTGALRPDSTKAYTHSYNYWFPLWIKKGQTCTVYIRMQGGNVTPFRTHIGTMHDLLLLKTKSNYTIIGLMAIILISIGLNLFLFFATRDNVYVIYSLYLFSGLIVVPYVMGFQYVVDLFPPDWKKPINLYFFAWTNIFYAAVIYFSIVFLKLRQRLPYFYYYLCGQFGFVTVVVPFLHVVPLLPFHVMAALFQANISVVYLSLLLMALYLWLKQNDYVAFIYMMAWVWIILFTFVYLLYVNGVLPYNYFTYHAPVWGISLEILFFSLAIGYRIKQMRVENFHLITEQNTLLERRVEERTEALNLANQALQSLNYTISQLLAIISHEFRSPLGAIWGFLVLLRDKHISLDEFWQYSSKIKLRLESLHFTLDNLLLWARSQMDGQHTLPEQFEVAPAAQEAIDLLHQVAADKQIEVVNALAPSQQAFADPEQIRTVLRNLLNNALKFTPTGGKVVFSQANPSPAWLQISVSDSGIGMSAETQAHLFDQSTQSTRGTANEKGTGLGLLLCKDFVEKNGGRIWVESQPEQGSTFYFTLPVSNG